MVTSEARVRIGVWVFQCEVRLFSEIIFCPLGRSHGVEKAWALRFAKPWLNLCLLACECGPGQVIKLLFYCLIFFIEQEREEERNTELFFPLIYVFIG